MWKESYTYIYYKKMVGDDEISEYYVVVILYVGIYIKAFYILCSKLNNSLRIMYVRMCDVCVNIIRMNE